jgi:hypothetical protein
MRISVKDVQWIRANIDYHLKNTIMDTNLEVFLKKLRFILKWR